MSLPTYLIAKRWMRRRTTRYGDAFWIRTDAERLFGPWLTADECRRLGLSEPWEPRPDLRYAGVAWETAYHRLKHSMPRSRAKELAHIWCISKVQPLGYSKYQMP